MLNQPYQMQKNQILKDLQTMKCLTQGGVGFLFAQKLHLAMTGWESEWGLPLGNEGLNIEEVQIGSIPSIWLKNKITSVAVPRNFLFGIDFRCSTDDSRLLYWDVSQHFINWLCARWPHPSHGIEIPNMRGNITPGNCILILMQIGIVNSICI